MILLVAFLQKKTKIPSYYIKKGSFYLTDQNHIYSLNRSVMGLI